MARPRTTRERELKLSVPPGFSLPDLPGEPLEPRMLTSTYFDTPDRALARAGVTLRRRVENRRGLWQLKLPGKGERLELESPGTSTTPPANLADLLVGILRGRRVIAPTPEEPLEAGDELLFVALPENEEALRRAMLPR